MTAAVEREHAPETVPEAVAMVRKVPDAHRTFEEGAAFARRTYGIGDELLAELLDAGLPSRGRDEDRRFERTDLHNIAMALRIPSPYFVALRHKARTLTRAEARGGTLEYALHITAGCPDPGHPGECAYEAGPSLLDVAEPGSVGETASGVFAARARVPADFALLGDDEAALLSLVAGWRLYVLPYTLSADEGFARETGLSNCAIAARVLYQEALTRGMEVRCSAGLLVSPPFATPHNWLEFRADGAWLPADPLLLQAFAHWGMTDPREWPPHRSVSGIVLRLTTDSTPLSVVRHNGAEAPMEVKAR